MEKKERSNVRTLGEQVEDFLSLIALDPQVSGIVVIIENGSGEIALSKRTSAPMHVLGILEATTHLVKKSLG